MAAAIAVLATGLLAAAGVFRASLTQGQGQERDAGAFVTRLIYAGLKIANDPALAPAERERGFTELMRKNLDTPRLARFVLGRYWQSASDAERSEFIVVYPPYLARIFAARLSQFGGAMVNVTAIRRLNDEIRVTTEIYYMGPKPASAASGQWELNWLIRATPEGMKIEDIDVQGTSLKLTERNALMSLIATAGQTVTGLIGVLRGIIAGTVGG